MCNCVNFGLLIFVYIDLLMVYVVNVLISLHEFELYSGLSWLVDS